MKTVLKSLVLIICFVAGLSNASVAQKFGYVKSAEILADFPDVKQAESNLESLQKVLQKKYQQSLEAFRGKVTAYQEAVQKGEKTPIAQETEGKALQAEEQELAKSQQDMVKQLDDKRTELLKPIYDKINEAIKAVADEEGYQFIFEQGVLLFAEDSQDITPKVKAKLGM